MAASRLVAVGLLLTLIGINYYLWGVTSDPHTKEAKSKPIFLPVVIPGPRTEDCGLRSLYVICKLAAVDVDLPRLRQLTDTSQTGTSMLALKDAATQLGFTASAKQVSWAALHQHMTGEGHFAILFCNKNHFVIAARATDEGILLVDTASAIQEIDEKGLTSAIHWNGDALLLGGASSRENTK